MFVMLFEMGTIATRHNSTYEQIINIVMKALGNNDVSFLSSLQVGPL